MAVAEVGATIGGAIAFLQSLSNEPWTRYFVILFFSLINGAIALFTGIEILGTIVSSPINLLFWICNIPFTFAFPVINGFSTFTLILATFPLWAGALYSVWSSD